MKKIKEPALSPEFEKTLVVSTGHITDHDDCILCRADGGYWEKHSFGYRIEVRGDGDEFKEVSNELKKFGFSAAFMDMITFARQLKADFIKLDSDGPIYPPLLKFNW